MDKIKSGDKFSVIANIINKAIEHCVPTGCVLPYVGTEAPEGWLLCNANSYPVRDYPELAKVLGYTSSDEYLTVPDLRGKYLKGGDNYSSMDWYMSHDGTLKTPFHVWNYGSIDMTSKYGYGVTASEKDKIDLPNVELNFIIKC